MATPSPGNSITVRVVSPSGAQATGQLTAAIAAAGGALTALDVVESHHDRLVIDVTCNTTDDEHAKTITVALGRLPGFEVRKVSDRTFLMHLGGKIRVEPKVSLRTRDDLSRVYTPGVARVCLAIAEHPEDARRLTIKRNTVAVVSDGSAVLGLGNIGPAAAMPVMEGKAALFKRFADVDAWPVASTPRTPRQSSTRSATSPRHTAASISRTSPRHAASRSSHDCGKSSTFRFSMTISTARLSWCSPLCETRCGSWANRCQTSASSCLASVQPARRSSGYFLLQGAKQIVASDRQGALNRADTFVEPMWGWVAEHTNPDGLSGSLKDVIAGADVFIGVSAPNLLDGQDIATMAPDAIVFALANPVPEVDPVAAREHAAIVATGRSDFPNQINNVLAFPGVFRGLLDVGAREITDAMLIAAADAIADVVAGDQLNPSYIVPSVFDASVVPAVAAAIREVAGHPALPSGSAIG